MLVRQWIEKNQGVLIGAADIDRWRGVELYNVRGRPVIVALYRGLGAWDVFIPAFEGSDIRKTFAALNRYIAKKSKGKG